MSIAILLKIFSDCCLCFSVLDAGPLPHDYPLLLPALICGISAAIATIFDRKALAWARKCCTVLPFSCLLLAGQWEQVTILLIPVGYTAAVILWGKLELEYYSFRSSFLKTLTLAAVAFVIACGCDILLKSQQESSIDTEVMLRYILMHLLCGVVLQRRLRLGLGSRAAGGRVQVASVVSVSLTIGFGFFAMEPLLRKSMGKALQTVSATLLAPLSYFIDGISNVIVEMENKRQEYVPDTTLGDVEEGVGIPGGTIADPIIEPVTKEEGNPYIMWMILAGVFIVIALIIMIYAYRKRREEEAQEQTVCKVEGLPKQKKTARLSPRNRVRQIYRAFLRSEKNLGMKLHRWDTSASVQERISPKTDEESAARLRQVYLQARYDDRKSIDRSHVEQAKQALKTSRKK